VLTFSSPRMAKGDVVAIPCLLMHRLEELWGSDANAWRPDRWLEDDGVSPTVKSLPGIYGNLLAFLGGTHACIGWKFSLYE
jgi:cytochrome P450